MRRMGILVVVNAAWLMLITIVVVVVLTLVIQSNDNVKTLLLDGKTASAISSKKTASEVRLLLAQQEFDHRQTQQGTKTLSLVVQEVEQHLDATIRAAIAQEAAKVGAELGH